MRNLRRGSLLFAGIAAGVALTVRCGGGPADSNAQSTGRSSVAGTWALALNSADGTQHCTALVHLAGSDASITGAWVGDACSSPYGGVPSGLVGGELAAGKVRLNFSISEQTRSLTFLADAAVASDGKSATGVAVGAAPFGGLCTASAGHCSFTLTAQ